MDDLTFEELQAIEARVQEIMQKYGETYDKAYKSVLQQFEAQQEIIENLEKIIQNSNDAKAVQEAQLALEVEQLKNKIRFGDLAEEELKNTKELLKLTEARNTQASKTADKFDNIFKSTLGITQQTGILNELLKEGAIKGLAQSIERTFTATNMLNAVMSKIVQSSLLFAVAQDDARVELNRATNAADKYGDQMFDIERDLRFYGVTLERATQAQTAMIKNMTNLRNISDTTSKQIGRTVALLDRMGISSDITTKNIEIMTRQLGLAPEEADKLNVAMLRLAQDLGMPGEEMISGFAQVAPEMAKFGDQGVEVYAGVAKAAREAGMEVSNLLAITNQFDRFDTAATAVGKLNAILGGPYLNTLEMVSETDPVARMRKLSDAVNSAGKSFQDLSYYERITIANGMGLKDVGELALIMRGEFEGLSDTMASMSEEELVKLKQEAIKYNKVQEEIIETGKILVMEFLYPAVKLLKENLQYIQENKNAIFAFAIALGLTVVVLKAFTLATKIASFMASLRIIQTKADTAAINENIIANMRSIDAMYAKAGAYKTLSSAMLSFGLGVLALGAGLLAMAGAFYVASMTIHEFGLSALGGAAALTAMGVGLYFLIPALTGLGAAMTGPQGIAAMAALATLGLTFVAIGLGVYLAAQGIAAMASSFAKLFEVATAVKMISFIAMLGVLATSLPVIALASIAAIPMLYALGAAFSYLASINTANLKPLASVFNSITNMLSADLDNLSAAKELIKEIADATNSIDSNEKVIKVQQVIDSITNAARGNLVATSAATTVAATAASAAMPTGPATPINFTIDFGNVKMRQQWGHIIGNYMLEKLEGKS